MKCGLIILSIFSLSVVSANAEFWFDDFDSYPAGPISDQVGWSANSASVVVLATGANSSPNALSLPYVSSGSRYARYNFPSGWIVTTRDRMCG